MSPRKITKTSPSTKINSRELCKCLYKDMSFLTSKNVLRGNPQNLVKKAFLETEYSFQSIFSETK